MLQIIYTLAHMYVGGLQVSCYCERGRTLPDAEISPYLVLYTKTIVLVSTAA